MSKKGAKCDNRKYLSSWFYDDVVIGFHDYEFCQMVLSCVTPWLTLCLWFTWLGTASWNFLVTSSECQRIKGPAIRYALYVPATGKRRPGRPHTSYLTYVQRLLGDNEGAMEKQQIAILADDRHAWRNLVIACSATDGWWWWWWCVTGRLTLNIVWCGCGNDFVLILCMVVKWHQLLCLHQNVT